jgi:hypothetical protein
LIFRTGRRRISDRSPGTIEPQARAEREAATALTATPMDAGFRLFAAILRQRGVVGGALLAATKIGAGWSLLRGAPMRSRSGKSGSQ